MPFLRGPLHGLRILWRAPGFAFAAIVALALGIGANTAIFSIIHAVLLQPLPYEAPDRIVYITGRTREFSNIPASGPDFEAWRRDNRVFEDVAAYSNYQSFNLKGAGDAVHVKAAAVTANFFSLLRVVPQIGRGFLPEEEQPGRGRVLLLSNAFWQTYFGGRHDVLGQTVNLDEQSFTIIGVLPRGFWYPDMEEDIWVPLNPDPANIGEQHLDSRDSHWLKVIGRLKPRVSLREAEANLNTIAAALKQQYPSTIQDLSIEARLLRDLVVRSSRSTLLLLFASVGLVFLIACVNVSNLLLARAAVRRKEVATRIALGASRGDLVRQLLGENLPLSIMGALVGLLLAYGTLKIIVSLEPGDIPRLHNATLNPAVLAFSLLLALLAILLFGLVPALQTSKLDLAEELRTAGRTTGAALRRSQARLAAAEIALALMLLVGSGLLIKTFASLLHADPGVDAHDVVTAQIQLPATAYSKEEAIVQFTSRLLEPLSGMPGVQYAGAVDFLPYGGLHNSGRFEIAGHSSSEKPFSEFRTIGGSYLRALGIPLLAGRDFSARDVSGAPPVAIISQSLAARFFAGENPLGRHIRHRALAGESLEIVGIVGDVKHWQVDEKPRPYIYVPMAQAPRGEFFLVVRGSAPPSALFSGINYQVRQLDRSVALYDRSLMQERVSRSLAPRRFSMALLTALAAIALALAMVGIYAVMSYFVAQRSQEIGLRNALGAGRSTIVVLFLREALRIVCLGVAVGIAVALVVTRFFASWIFGMTADPLIFLIAALAAILVGLMAAAFPALRASKLDAAIALRAE